jgi:adenosylhomocysteine nucleosidase
MIGIIVAMTEELEEILKLLDNVQEEKQFDLTFYKGTLSNKICLVTKSGVGKVNAARTAQIMIDKYNIKQILNIGVAGACSPNINIGDIVIGNKFYQYDFDITIFNYNLGYIPKIGDYIESTNKYLDYAENSFKNNFKVHIGTIVSGDKFISDKEEKINLNKKFSALCCEMEGASIAQVCYLSKVPFLVIRAISDTLNADIKEEYENFLKTASEKSALALKDYLNK